VVDLRKLSFMRHVGKNTGTIVRQSKQPASSRFAPQVSGQASLSISSQRASALSCVGNGSRNSYDVPSSKSPQRTGCGGIILEHFAIVERVKGQGLFLAHESRSQGGRLIAHRHTPPS